MSVISTGLLPFLDVSSSSPTDGFALYAALLRCHPSQVGHNTVLLPSLPAAVFTATSAAAPSPEEVPLPLKQDAPAVLLRRGGGWKPSVFQVQLAEGHDAVVKHYRVSTPFTQEQKVLLLCAEAGVPAPRLLLTDLGHGHRTPRHSSYHRMGSIFLCTRSMPKTGIWGGFVGVGAVVILVY